jgi:ribosomal protein L19
MDAELAGFVAGGGDDTALVGPTANDNRLAAEVGALQEFHGDEEGVHVHVEDGRVEGEITLFGGIVFGAETSEVRHAFTVRKKADSLS